jgi:phosphoesterase RecJ-like protein
MPDTPIKEVAQSLLRAKRIVITSHIDPDGDCLGSQLALHRALANMGKDALIVSFSELPRMFYFLIHPHEVQIVKTLDWDYDIAVILDSGDLVRVGDPIMNSLDRTKPIINIDHHKSNTYFGTLNYVDGFASSTAELLLAIFDELGLKIDLGIAYPLYVGIVTDSGNFSYSNTSQKTHYNAARLIALGVEPSLVKKYLQESKDISNLKLLSLALATIRLYFRGQVATMTITQEMLANTGADWGEINGFVDYGRSLEGVEVALLFRETGEGQVKVSMRSKGNVDVDFLARYFGGGGHEAASGCVIDGDIPAAKEQVLQVLKVYLDDLNARAQLQKPPRGNPEYL